MLAERVEIDYRTRWRDASLILQMDARYKNIEDPIEREELFNDFIAELEKKERHDRLLKKDQASTKFIEFLECLVKDNKINYKSGKSAIFFLSFDQFITNAVYYGFSVG